MKKALKVVLVLLLSILVIGCSQKETPADDTPVAEKDALARIQEKGKMVIATEGMWAPYTYEDANGTLTGYDVEVARAVCAKLGVEAEFVTGDFDGFLIGLDNGTYDAVFNCIDVTEERAAKYDFTDPYINSVVALIVRNDNEEIKSFEDLSGKTTTNTITSSYAATAEEYGATVLGAATLEETLNIVVNGRADATLNSEGSFNDYMKVHADTPLKIVDSFTSYAAVPLKKGDDTASLREAINKALGELKADGTLTELSMKFFEADMSGSNN